jgi:hypothetical protein
MRNGLKALALGSVVAVAGLLPLYAQGSYTVVLHSCPTDCLSVLNAFIRADVDPSGKFVEGTTGGDPSTPLDDNKRLLYGFQPGAGLVGTSFTTVRIERSGAITDFIASEAVARYGISSAGFCPPDCAGTCPPECAGVVTAWQVRHPGASVPAADTVRITETLVPMVNPYTGRPDVIRAEYFAVNHGSAPVRIGVRSLFDVRVGGNDGAPYIIPGVGALTTERDFLGPNVPDFWLAFESPLYEPSQLRAVGILKGFGLNPPDRFLVSRWASVQVTRWDYAPDPSALVTEDSAVALYWNPETVAPGGARSFRTAYGVAGNSGGAAFLSSPVSATCDAFTVALFVSNFAAEPLTGGVATLSLVPGLSLAAGESAAKPLATINPGDTASVAWSVVADPGANGRLRASAQVRFSGGGELTTGAEIDVACEAPTPTATPTATPTSLPSPSPTATPTRTVEAPTPTNTAAASATPLATPVLANVCPFILDRVPLASINLALAQPDRINGYQTLCFPNRPPSPTNGLRTWLSIRNISVRYHPLHNPLVFKCGCP